VSECIVVTGASGGIGRACADLLTAGGRTVVNLDWRPPGSEASAEFLALDLRDEVAVRNAFAEIATRHEVVGLVNNAGVSRSATLEETTFDDLAACVEVNLAGVIACTQAALPSMKRLGRGRIVNLASRTALGKEGRTAYAATKGGVIAMTRVWALELAAYGITVNAVAPGPVATEMYRAVNPPDAPETRKLVAAIPLGRLGEPADVAHAVAFFLDEQAGFITGQTLYVCGGLSVGAAPV
jgi:3-oxoacyl-[acyl-carrier protein] reductase